MALALKEKTSITEHAYKAQLLRITLWHLFKCNPSTVLKVPGETSTLTVVCTKLAAIF